MRLEGLTVFRASFFIVGAMAGAGGLMLAAKVFDIITSITLNRFLDIIFLVLKFEFRSRNFLLLGLVTAVVAYSGTKLGETWGFMTETEKYQKVCRGAKEPYPEICRAAFGKIGFQVSRWLILTNLFLVTGILAMLTADNVRKLFESVDVQTRIETGVPLAKFDRNCHS